MKPDASPDASPLDTLLAQREAWNRGDLDGYLRGCAPEITYVTARGVVRGLDALRASLRAAYPDRAAMGTLDLEVLTVDQHPTDQSPTVTHVVLRWSVRSSETTIGGVALAVLQRRDGRWWLTHDATLRCA